MIARPPADAAPFSSCSPLSSGSPETDDHSLSPAARRATLMLRDDDEGTRTRMPA